MRSGTHRSTLTRREAALGLAACSAAFGTRPSRSLHHPSSSPMAQAGAQMQSEKPLGTVRLLLTGDVMLGESAASVATATPTGPHITPSIPLLRALLVPAPLCCGPLQPATTLPAPTYAPPSHLPALSWSTCRPAPPCCCSRQRHRPGAAPPLRPSPVRVMRAGRPHICQGGRQGPLRPVWEAGRHGWRHCSLAGSALLATIAGSNPARHVSWPGSGGFQTTSSICLALHPPRPRFTHCAPHSAKLPACLPALQLAEAANGPLPRQRGFDYPWGVALRDMQVGGCWQQAGLRWAAAVIRHC